MKRIFCIGETVLDIIFRDHQPVAARPGGSMLNTSVSLGLTGMRPFFISDFGKDTAGDFVERFLQESGVRTQFIERFSDGQTSVSLAFLNNASDASYSFYRNYPPERKLHELPKANPGDIVMFGSFYAISHEVRTPLWDFLVDAKSRGAFLVYDPNFRTPHLKQLHQFSPWIFENIDIAHITRGSAGDFMHIFETEDSAGAYREVVAHGGTTLVYTKSNQGVEVITPELHLTVEVPSIYPISTIGAGDAFNAGLIYSLAKLPSVNPLPLAQPEWERIIRLAVEFSTNVCLSLDNYISNEFANQVSHV